MNTDKQIEQINQETLKLYAGAKVEWSKSKELIWENNFDELFQETKVKKLSFSQQIIRLSIAASFLLLIGIGSFGWFYTKTINSAPGTHQLATLPDNSTVEMNAASTLSFHPFRWKFQRNVRFEGEGFFSVQKGSKFTVISPEGSTSVLGTSFNIFARDNEYRVFCKTGKVKVTSGVTSQVLLTPGQMAQLTKGAVLRKTESSPEHVLSWRMGNFLFSAAPFRQVINEIERQYNVSINTSGLGAETISVSFTKDPDITKVLAIVCKPLGYDFVKMNERKFLIREARKK